MFMKRCFAAILCLLMLGMSVSFSQTARAESIYVPGDVIEDFTVTTSDGQTVSLQGLLSEYKAVVLNLWYVNCQWCVYEFPFMQEAYAQFKDDIAILALTPYDDDKAINAFKAENGLTFLMGMDTIGLCDRFDVSGYPTTVIIDRFGVYCFVEVGAQSSTDSFVRLFTPFAAEEYTESLVGFEIPETKPDIAMPPAADMAAAMNAPETALEYFADEDEYIWPWLVGTDGDRTYAYSSNAGILETEAYVHTRVNAKAGDALVFEYRTSTKAGGDYLALTVNGDAVKVFSGINDWAKYAYAFPETGEYDVAFGYQKFFMGDASECGEDTVCIDNVALVSGSNAEEAVSANRQYVQVLDGKNLIVEPISADAKEIVINDPTESILGMLGNAKYYIVPEGSVDFRVVLGKELDFDAVNGYCNYDGAAITLNPEADDERGYLITCGLDTTATTGYSWSMVQMFGVFNVYDDFYGSAVYFASEEEVNAFCANDIYDGEGNIASGVTWRYADGTLPGTTALPAPADEASEAAYTLIFTDQNGDAVPGVIANICDETTCMPMTSDENGLIEFVKAPYEYDIHVLKIPKGYAFDTAQAFKAPLEGGNMTFIIDKQ